VKNTLLTPEQRDRFVELVDMLNDLSVTQLDTDEAAEFRRLLSKLTEQED
jgi:hypothetical protein